jgi:transcriptional regulator with XRE-family HTH domain
MGQETGERIAELRKTLGLTQAQFAERIGLKFSAISMIERGKAPLTESNMDHIHLAFGACKEWLRDGTGEMLDEEAGLSDPEMRLIKSFRRLSPTAQKYLIDSAEGIVKKEEDSKKDPSPST